MSGARPRSVALIEDDAVLGASLEQRLRLEGVEVWWARTVAEGEALLRRHRPTMVVCDMRLPDGTGEDLLARLMPELGSVPIIFVTAYGDVAQAVRLIRAGADDYVQKPFEVEQLLKKLDAFAASAGPAPRAAGPGATSRAGWRSPVMHELHRALTRLARLETAVLLSGESGAGKEVAASGLHELGPRAPEPFVVLNCAAIPAELFESEVFGHERGSFTGASQRHAGAAERAGAGTLFLDEVAELAPSLQAKLLRLLEARTFSRVGGRDTLPFRARVVAASNASLAARVADGAFREDLFYRLAVVELAVPPLRERPQDLLDLTDMFLDHFAVAFGRERPSLSDAARQAQQAHPWPGNVRELRNRIERAMALTDSNPLQPADLFPERARGDNSGDPAMPATLAEARDAAEREHIRRVLARCGGRPTEAAKVLGIARTTLWERMRRLGLETADAG